MDPDLVMDPRHTTLIKQVVWVGAVDSFSAFIWRMVGGWVSQWSDQCLFIYKDKTTSDPIPRYEMDTHNTWKYKWQSCQYLYDCEMRRELYKDRQNKHYFPFLFFVTYPSSCAILGQWNMTCFLNYHQMSTAIKYISLKTYLFSTSIFIQFFAVVSFWYRNIRVYHSYIWIHHNTVTEN